MAYKDITGKRFGRLVAIKLIAEKYKKTKWLCECDCGKEKITLLSSLVSGRTSSCGCFRKKVTSERMKKHGLTNKALYKTWLNMRTRCTNPNSKSYKNYGKRGISVCEEWDNFESFYNWSLKNGYSNELTLDRIDNNGNYEPSNCRWATREIQANNTSKNVFIEIDGTIRTLSDHAKAFGLSYEALYYRYENGAKGQELIQPLKKSPILITINNETKPLKAWSRFYNISYGTLRYRYNKGIRDKELFKPVDKIMSEKANKRKWESA